MPNDKLNLIDQWSEALQAGHAKADLERTAALVALHGLCISNPTMEPAWMAWLAVEVGRKFAEASRETRDEGVSP